MEFKTNLMLNGLLFRICGEYYPPRGNCSDDVDLYEITFADEDLTFGQEEFLIEGYGRKKFNTWLLKEGRLAFESAVWVGRRLEAGE